MFGRKHGRGRGPTFLNPRSIIEKIWNEHVVAEASPGEDLLFIESVQALRSAGRSQRTRGWCSAWSTMAPSYGGIFRGDRLARP